MLTFRNPTTFNVCKTGVSSVVSLCRRICTNKDVPSILVQTVHQGGFFCHLTLTPKDIPSTCVMCRRVVSVGSVAKVSVLLRFSGPLIFSMLTENQGSLFRVMDTPEPPSKGFFSSLFSSAASPLDREQLCEY